MKSENFKIQQLKNELILLKNEKVESEYNDEIDLVEIFEPILLHMGDYNRISDHKHENFLLLSKSFKQSDLLKIYISVLKSNERRVRIVTFLKFEKYLMDETIKMIDPIELREFKRTTERLIKIFPNEFKSFTNNKIIIDVDKVVSNTKSMNVEAYSNLKINIGVVALMMIINTSLIYGTIDLLFVETIISSGLTFFTFVTYRFFLELIIKRQYLKNLKQKLLK